MTDVLQIATSVIGGGFVGSIATHYLTTGRERREIRSTALTKLSDVEAARWAGDHSRAEFIVALRDLETAALIARLPRDLVLLYQLLAETARDQSDSDIEDDPMQPPDLAGQIDLKYTAIVRDTASEISRAIWAPITTRIKLRTTVRNLEQRALNVEKRGIRHNLDLNTDFYSYHWHVKPEPRNELPRPR